jgi:hypothetical protein
MEKSSSKRITPANMKALYAYFGEFGIFDQNIPGHSFYQIGLLTSLSEKYDISKFDVYNYLDGDDVQPNLHPTYPDGRIGELMNSVTNQLVDSYRLPFTSVWKNIANKDTYDYIFLKARFRNLSTLAKKMEDAKRFEVLIQYALSTGHKPESIIVLDTDLSMSSAVSKRLADLKIQVVVPSIDFPGIGRSFLKECLQIHKDNPVTKEQSIVYHGNVDFSNYKEGHAKNPIVKEVIEAVNHEFMFDQSVFHMFLCAKDTPELVAELVDMPRVTLVPRNDRGSIWKHLSESIVSLNVSKDLYLERGFIPARVYEAIIAGTIPVSYRNGQHPAMTFNTSSQFYEICKFLAECSPTDYYKVLEAIAKKL